MIEELVVKYKKNRTNYYRKYENQFHHFMRKINKDFKFYFSVYR